jgi:hypothetical protein
MSDEFDDTFDRPPWSAAAASRGPGADAPSIPDLVADAYQRAPAPLQVRLLECLIQPVGPLALAAVAAGAFGRLLYAREGQLPSLSIDDVARISAEQVQELARFVEQCSPDAFTRIGNLLAGHPIGLLSTLGGSILMLAIGAWRRRPPA